MSAYNKFMLFIITSCLLAACNNKEIIFNSNNWINCTDVYKRELVLSDLLKNHLNIGMSREKVISIIGKPEKLLKSNERKPYGVFWSYKTFDENPNLAITKKDSLLYIFYTETDSDSIVKIDRYTVGFNGSGPNFMLIIYDKSDKFVDYKFENTEF